jgi:hypothetical protein
MSNDNTQDGAEPSSASAGYAREWRVVERWCDTLGEYRYCLLHPQGFVDSSFERSPIGRSEAQGWADTYNMNSDKAAAFRQCPYCKDRCPWCA